MRLGSKIYRGTVTAKEFFERAGLRRLVSLAKLAVEAVLRVTTVDGGIRFSRPGWR